MIRRCADQDFASIQEVINDAAIAYKGIIPKDRWHEPYMTAEHLEREIADGVVFWGFEDEGELVGIMGIQPVDDVELIRHAYVRTARRRGGIGGKLLRYLEGQIENPLLVGTWAAAGWAIRFYERHGFSPIASVAEKDRLLRTYWSIPARQIETSVVLANAAWFARKPRIDGHA